MSPPTRRTGLVAHEAGPGIASHRQGAPIEPEGSACRVVRLPVLSLTAALDHLDGRGLCAGRWVP